MMKTLKLTLAAAALGALVTLPVTSAHAWGGWGPGYGLITGVTTGWVMAGATAILTATSAST